MTDNPVPFKTWAEHAEYPTLGILYNWTRPSSVRDELLAAGVIARINGRWLFNPPRWREYCVDQVRRRHAAA